MTSVHHENRDSYGGPSSPERIFQQIANLVDTTLANPDYEDLIKISRIPRHRPGHANVIKLDSTWRRFEFTARQLSLTVSPSTTVKNLHGKKTTIKGISLEESYDPWIRDQIIDYRITWLEDDSPPDGTIKLYDLRASSDDQEPLSTKFSYGYHITAGFIQKGRFLPSRNISHRLVSDRDNTAGIIEVARSIIKVAEPARWPRLQTKAVQIPGRL